MAAKGMQRLHGDAEAYWRYQYRYGSEVLLPLLASWGWNVSGTRVLEVGCSEAGILGAFAEKGATVTGAEISESRIKSARSFQRTPFPVLSADICDPSAVQTLGGGYDLILLRDVIEHLFDRETAFDHLKQLLAPGGRIVVTFPPWYMPFGGHQQALPGPLRKVPWLHLLPMSLYVRLLHGQVNGQDWLVREMVNTRRTGLTIAAFHRLLNRKRLQIERETRWLINPAYTIKYGLAARPAGWLGKVPLLREVAVTSVYAMLKPVGK